MSTKRSINGKALAWLLTLVYFTSYMTRKNFATVLQEAISDTNIPKETLSIVLVAMTVTYGVGQIINGRLGDKFKPTNMIFCGLLIATAVNIIFPFISSSVISMAIFWGINGFAQSMMWPPIVKILVTNCDDKMYNYSSLRISWGSSFATIALYLIAPLTISVTGSWKAIFLVSSIIGVAACITWFFVKSRISVHQSENENVPAEIIVPQKNSHFSVPRSAIFPLIFIIFAIVFQGMLRDGVANWTPTILADVYGMSNHSAILSGAVLAIFSIVCFAISSAVYKRFFTNEVLCGALIFGVAILAALILFILFGKSSLVAIICLTLITGCMHGVNLMLITHVPKRFKKHGNISTFAGILNACTYIGEAIFTYGLALIANHFSWRTSIAICFAMGLLGMICCIIASQPWNKFTKE